MLNKYFTTIWTRAIVAGAIVFLIHGSLSFICVMENEGLKKLICIWMRMPNIAFSIMLDVFLPECQYPLTCQTSFLFKDILFYYFLGLLFCAVPNLRKFLKKSS